MSSPPELIGNTWNPLSWYFYLKDTERRRWWSHRAWSVSEAGTGPTPDEHCGPRPPLHPYCWHILGSVITAWEMFTSCLLVFLSKLCQEWVKVAFLTPPPTSSISASQVRSEGGPGNVRHKTPGLGNCKQLPLFKMLPWHTNTNIDTPTPMVLQRLTYGISCIWRKAPQSSEWECPGKRQRPALEVWGAFWPLTFPLPLLALTALSSYIAHWTPQEACLNVFHAINSDLYTFTTIQTTLR